MPNAEFRLTILGASPAAPNPGGANSGYLVRFNNTAVVMDCGPGTAGRIAQHVAANRLDAVAISHLHPDHYFDLVALYYTLRFGEPRPSRLPLWVPPGARDFLDRLGRLITDRAAFLEDVFDLHEYAPGPRVQLGELEFTFYPVQHYILSHAMRIQAPDGTTLVFSSDVAPCPQLVDAAKGADLFLCESALFDPSQDEKDLRKRGHMSAVEAGAAAHEAGAKRLVITHYRSNEKADAHHLAMASKSFGGPVQLAREGETYVVG